MNIEKLEFFEGMDTDIVKQINNSGSTRTFQPGDTIFETGKSAQFLYILEQGGIDLKSDHTDRADFSLDKPGEVFGWSSLVEKGVYTSTATCRSEARVRCIPKTDIEPVLNGSSQAAMMFYRRIGDLFTRRMPKVVQ